MKLKFSILILMALGTLLLFPMVGSTGIPNTEILLQLRIPRVLTAFLSGVALATSGMIFQALFRNPLSTPFTLGVSGGAALGAALWMRFGPVIALTGIAATSLAGFFGALLAVFLVYGLARAKGGFATNTLLLAGVAVNFFFSSLILLIQYFSDAGETFRMIRWLMGGFSVIGFQTPIHLAIFTIAGLAVCGLLTREMNLLLTGDEIAGARGVNVDRTRKLLFFSASLMTGAAVAFCGPIGFVGLMVPHICRKLFNADHRKLLPAVILFGGFFMTACDGLARTLLAPVEMPAGLITALLGGPFFIGLLLKGKS
ncbi:FecCD family ABC transporter permease [Tichowtungia aerotolerans]|uniref:Iron chelate uptake ABC transporter family permease subunit n=1 Tax=Tichowtungia aerotolerans TaxID=2697043 RepID=A0A6P1M9T0_9BACT|nr:iron ABC transporter permease [Tichowtungia aerotolerans]QHI70802.1 iron chelate uptake ABC transporter family permease subunit [Tichowtungia aerotolerans]